MKQENPAAAKQPRSGKLGPAIRIAAIVLLLALAALAGTRIAHWRAREQESRLMALVNPWNGIENVSFTPRLTTVEGVQVEKSIQKPLEELLAACRAAGYEPRLLEGYVSPEGQEQRFEQQLQALEDLGLSREEAEAMMETDIYRPGYCEQELGLSVAFYLSTDADSDPMSAWLKNNAARYGFILRYPESGREVTGNVSDAIYRYVGQAAAEQIQALGITLEEYQAMFYGESAAVIFE